MKKAPLSPKELMAAETNKVAVPLKSVEDIAATNSFDDDESEGEGSKSDDASDEEGEEQSGDDSDDERDRGRSRSAQQVLGKEGWLYRENDPQLRLAEPFTKVWVSILGNRLLFSRDGGSSGAFSLFEATQKAQSVCFGYLDLRPGSEVKKQLISNRGARGKAGQGQDQERSKKYQFLVRDGDASVMFGADTEAQRDEWVEVIKQAIHGTSHFLPLSHLSVPAGAALDSAGAVEAASNGGAGASTKRGSIVPAAVDFPNKAGYLKKTSTGKSAFGISTVKKRWFRLAAGELRYYEDEDESATRLKDCVSLEGAEVFPVQGQVVTVQFAGGRAMRLEAATGKVANEWRDAFAETITLLRNMPASAKATTAQKPVRRLNVHDSDLDRAGASALDSAPASAANSPNGPGGARRGRAATTIGVTTSSFRKTTAGEGDSSDDDEQASPVPAGSFWGRLSISSKSPTAPAGQSPSTKSRSQSSLTLGSTTAAAAAATSDYRPKFLNNRSSTGFGGAGGVHKGVETVELLRECLQQNFLLKRLPDVTPLIDVMVQHVAVPGEVIIWQGSSGDAFYALESGQCDVIKDGRVVSRIPAGKSFGELALVNNAVRQATIRASQVCTLWTFTRNQYREVAMRQEARLMEERIAFLEGIELFSKLMRSSLEKIAEVMVLRSYNTGERIIRQGDAGDAFYMIQQGRAVVTQTSTFSTSSGTELARLGPGKYFGELALIEDAPRKATVTATSACKCWTLDRHNFKFLFGSMAAAVNESVGIKMLQKVKILEALTEAQLQAVARCLVSKEFTEGEVIIKQGDVGDCFYLISSGEVSVQVNHIQVATLESGSFFGEMSLLSNERRSATVAALKDTVCLVLSRADFNELLGPLEEVNAEARRRKEAVNRPKGDGSGSGRFISSLRKVSNSLFTSSPTSSPPGPGIARSKSLNAGKSSNALFSATNAMFDLGSLERIKKLGSGTFGTVFLVQHIMTNKYYAMKVLHKQHLKETCQEQNVFTERDVMLLLGDTLYAAELYATMQDAKSVYLVMQFLPGGDLWELLHNGTKLKKTKEGGFTLNKALFYMSNALAAVSHMHQQEIVYRNIKPENLVIDNAGYLKLVDFGSAKLLPGGSRTNTLCGAAEYIAPEMVLSKGYNRAIDFWALGVLFFELLTGTTPFAHANLSMVYQNIMDSEGVVKLIFSGGHTKSASSAASSAAVAAAGSATTLDSQAKDVITNLLLFNPNMRLGMRHDGVHGIWGHPCFREFAHAKVEGRSLKAPYVPEADETELAVASDHDVLDVLEDEDDIPAYRGTFDYSDF